MPEGRSRAGKGVESTSPRSPALGHQDACTTFEAGLVSDISFLLCSNPFSNLASFPFLDLAGIFFSFFFKHNCIDVQKQHIFKTCNLVHLHTGVPVESITTIKVVDISVTSRSFFVIFFVCT